MIRKKSRFRKIKRLLSVLLLLAMFLGAGLLPPTFAYITAQTPTTQSLPNAENLVEQGRKLYEAEQFAQAITIWQQAVAAFKASGDEPRQAMTLGNISLAYQQLEQWTQAQSAIASSLNLQGYPVKQGRGAEGQRGRGEIPIQNLEILAQVLDIQGRLQLAQSKAENALNTWREAADIYTQLGDRNSIIRNRINSAQALQALGLFRQAQKTLTETTQLLQNQPNSALKVTGVRSLGNVLLAIGDLEQSRQVLEQSLAVASKLPDKQAIADVLLSLGNTARAQQDSQAAIDFYQQAANATKSPITRINAQTNQLRLLLETKRLADVKTLLPQIQTQIGNLPPSRTAIYARINLAESLMQFKQKSATDSPSWLDIAQILSTAVQQAQDLQDRRTQSYALGVLGNLYEQKGQLTDAQNLTQQALFLAQTIDARDIAYRWEWQLGRLLKARGNIQEAIAAYDRAVKSLQSLRYDLVAINPDVQFDFRDRVEPVYRQLVELLLQPQGNQTSQANLQKARETIESLQLAELDNFFREACLDTVSQIDQVIDQKDQTAAAIYPIILPDRLEVILKLPQKPVLHYTAAVAQTQVEKTLDALRQNLIEPDTLVEAKALSQQVYNWLIQPAVTDLAKSQVKTLVFVLDGALRNIPMAALYDGKQYLIEKYGIALTPGLQLINPQPLQEKTLEAIAAGLSQPRQGFSALPNVKLELAEIRAEIPSNVLLNNEFTSTALQNQINSLPFPVVHLATHGQFSSKAEETFIVAWDKRIYVNELDNLVRNREQNRPDAVELLVLSACETAAGDKRAALGIAGVAVRAGARSTVASLWSLNDESTAALMSEFYRELADRSLTKAEALRRAQLSLLQNPKYQRPLFWAPYVLLGNWL
ncbi:CHAT domain-containing protein [Chroococcidiopsis sp. CCNUC1]|uniref:CHAT domain-containing protein n=1 Tax=Chroococcidiopsis sp. CCNUC1 TaxID=2653189 RepID=UPI002020CF57|nr:CHAT domain-containing protein [Chroococcidiopsis sp. CCNUC1]URD48510.1 CHAT domain-containing protein [Chroococcidiopsis sp. CCNUC1]